MCSSLVAASETMPALLPLALATTMKVAMATNQWFPMGALTRDDLSVTDVALETTGALHREREGRKNGLYQQVDAISSDLRRRRHHKR